jgi:hypothetical protein
MVVGTAQAAHRSYPGRPCELALPEFDATDAGGHTRVCSFASETVSVDSVYLSAQHPRWQITSANDLQAAVDQGLIGESHYLDMKRELTTTKGGNRELARDLASFAVDGGTLIIGIDEDKTVGTFSLVPQPLKGAEEHVEQVARDIPDPPLVVITRRVALAGDPETGFIVVHVPSSPTAPHMVDNRYLGRGDKTKHYLSDAEVVRLHGQRRSQEADGVAMLRAEFERDPIPADQRKHAHLFLLAEPVAARPEMLLGLTGGADWNRRLAEFIERAQKPDVNEALQTTGGFSPDISYASNGARRPRGAARAAYHLRSDRSVAPDSKEKDIVEVEVHEDGGLRIFMGRFSDTYPDGEDLLLDVAAVVYVRRLLALVAAAADESGYFGNWVIGVGATNLRGRRSSRWRSDLRLSGDGPRYSDDTYERVTVASYPELVNDPGAVAGRVVGRLLRALGTNDLYPAAAPRRPA